MNYINDNWNQWTIKSDNVSFISNQNAIGHGEQKLGAEFDVIPLGQNFTYDLEVLGERWEVKKLDDDNSFRLGVNVATLYTPLISNLIRVLEKLIFIKQDLLECEIGNQIKSCIHRVENISGRSNTLLIDGLRKNEVSESNLNKANSIIEDLKVIMLSDGTLNLHSSIDGLKNDYCIIDAFRKIMIEKISIEEKIQIIGDRNNFNRLLLTNLIYDDMKIFEGRSLRENLNQIIRSVFSNVKLVLVDDTRGFKPITNLEYIYCNRITSGFPRCKIL